MMSTDKFTAGDVIQINKEGQKALIIERLGPRNGQSEFNYYFVYWGTDELMRCGAAILNNYEKVGSAKQKEELQELVLKNPHIFYHNYNTRITIGSDPEMFVVDKKNVVIPAFSFLQSKGDSAKEAKAVYAARYGTSTYATYESFAYWDGFQAEITTPAASCLENLTAYVQRGMVKVQQAHPDGRIVPENVVEIPEELLLKAEEVHVRLGCMPSFNIYDMRGRDAGNGRDLGWRCAGVHLHFGIGEQEPEMIARLVKVLDASAGVASVALFGERENPVRREFYGLPGEFRLPKHGLEYRTLGSGVLAHPQWFHLLFDMGRYALRLEMAGLRELAGLKWDEKKVIRAIMRSDVDAAREIMAENEEFWRGFFKGAYSSEIPWRWLVGDKKVKQPKTDSMAVAWGLNNPLEFSGSRSSIRNFVGSY